MGFGVSFHSVHKNDRSEIMIMQSCYDTHDENVSMSVDSMVGGGRGGYLSVGWTDGMWAEGEGGTGG